MLKIPFKRQWIQGRTHKFARGIALWLSWRNAVDLILWVYGTLVTLWLAAYALEPAKQKLGWWLFAIYVGLVIIRLITSLPGSSERERLRRRLALGCLTHLHEEVFKNDSAFRFTLFIADPVASVKSNASAGQRGRCDVLVPYVRRESAGDDPYCRRSRAFFPTSSHAITSHAWKQASSALHGLRSPMWVASFPDFSGDRAAMRKYYRDVLRIEDDVIDSIGNTMARATRILSYPLVDHDAAPMALLSIDFLPEGKTTDLRDFPLDQHLLEVQVKGIRSILLRGGFHNQL